MRVSRWQIAQTIAYEDLTLSIETIDRYLKESKSVQNLVQTSVKRLELVITEAEGDYTEIPTTAERMSNHETRPLPDIPQSIVTTDDGWIHVKGNLVRFASRLDHMPRMKSFSFVLFVYFEPSPVQDDVLFTSISTLLCSLPTTLASLTIDNSGAPSSPNPEPRSRHNHFCSLLLNKNFMPHLRHLCIRSRNICPEILEAFSSDQYARLESVIINLSLGREDRPGLSKVFYAHFCSGFQSNGKDLYSSLIDAAKAILPRLPSLKTFRIIRQNFPSEDFFSFDVTCNRRVELPSGIHWKATGSVDADDDECSSEGSEWSQDSAFSPESVDETS